MKTVLAVAAALGLSAAAAPAAFATAADCPNGGTVRFGVEPFEAAARLTPIFSKIGEALGKKIDCTVQVLITTNYTAETEAMRNGRLEIAEFGPLGYVLAHQVAHAEAVAAYAAENGTAPDTYTASIVTWPGSGITSLSMVAGKSFAYSDPASTSGHLFPAYALRQIGIDPDKGIQAFYAGSHTASFEAIRNHKVLAGELNSTQIASGRVTGNYKPEDFVTLWQSSPIPNDPIAVSATLAPGFRARVTQALQTFDLSTLSADDLKTIGSHAPHMVPQTDAAYDGIRDLVKTLNIDLTKLGE